MYLTLILINWPRPQDVEEAMVTLLEGSLWEEALRIVSGSYLHVCIPVPSQGGDANPAVELAEELDVNHWRKSRARLVALPHHSLRCRLLLMNLCLQQPLGQHFVQLQLVKEYLPQSIEMFIFIHSDIITISRQLIQNTYSASCTRYAFNVTLMVTEQEWGTYKLPVMR